MGGGDKTKGRGALIQQGFYPLGHLIQGQDIFDLRAVIPADLMILAIAAVKIAMGEKYIADAVFSADGRLFPLVKTDGPDLESGSCAAISQLPGKPVCPAFPGTAHAGAKSFRVRKNF
jgi:hypothetical protein